MPANAALRCSHKPAKINRRATLFHLPTRSHTASMVLGWCKGAVARNMSSQTWQRHRTRSSQGPAEKPEHREPCYEYVKRPLVPPCDALTDSTYQQAHHGVPAFYELTHHVHGVRPVYRRASSTMLPGMGTCRHVKVQARSRPKARTLGTMPGQTPANAALRCSHKPAKINRRATLFHLPTRSHTASMVRGWCRGKRVPRDRKRNLLACTTSSIKLKPRSRRKDGTPRTMLRVCQAPASAALRCSHRQHISAGASWCSSLLRAHTPRPWCAAGIQAGEFHDVARVGTCRHVKVQARSRPKARTLGTMPGQMPANAALRCSHKPAKINRRATLFHLPTRSHTASMVLGWCKGAVARNMSSQTWQRHRTRSSQGPAEKPEHREPCYEYVKRPLVPPCDALTDSTYQQAHHGVPAFYELTHHVHCVRPVYRRASSTMLPGMGTCRHVKVQARSRPKARTLGTMPGQTPANAALRCSHKPAKINRRATLFHLPTRSHTASMVRGWCRGKRVPRDRKRNLLAWTTSWIKLKPWSSRKARQQRTK